MERPNYFLVVMLLVGTLVPAMFSDTLWSQPAKRASTEKEVLKLLKLLQTEALMRQVTDQVIEQLRQNVSQPPQRYWNSFKAKLDYSEVMGQIAAVYERYLTANDIRALHAFYSSPVGSKLIRVQPRIMAESMAIGQEWGRDVAERAMKEVGHAEADRSQDRKR